MKNYIALLSLCLLSSTSLLNAASNSTNPNDKVSNGGTEKSATKNSEKDSLVGQEKNTSNQTLTIDKEGKIYNNGKLLEKKISARGEALQGTVESIEISQGKLKVSGWSADIGKGGPSKSVTILYKNKEVGSVPVDQVRDLNSHFAHYKVPGNYSKVGFVGTFPFPQSKDKDFDLGQLKVIAQSEDGYASLIIFDQKKVSVK